MTDPKIGGCVTSKSSCDLLTLDFDAQSIPVNTESSTYNAMPAVSLGSKVTVKPIRPPDYQLDPKSYIRWASGLKDVGQKENALNTVADHLLKTGMHDDVNLMNELKALYFSLIKDGWKNEGAISFENMRSAVTKITQLHILVHRFGYNDVIKTAQYYLTAFGKEEARLVERIEERGLKCFDNGCKLDMVSYIKYRYPIDEEPTTWRPQNLTWYKIAGNNQLRVDDATVDALEMASIGNRPYTIVEFNGETYARLEGSGIVRAEFEGQLKDTSDLIAQLFEARENTRKFEKGIERDQEKQREMLAELEEIYSVGYEYLASFNKNERVLLASLDAIPIRMTGFYSASEANFEMQAHLVDKMMQVGEFNKASKILESLFKRVVESKEQFDKVKDKQVSLAVTSLEVGSVAMDNTDLDSMERVLIGFEQFKKIDRLIKLTRSLPEAEAHKYEIIAAKYRARAHYGVGNYEGAIDTAWPFLSEIDGQLDRNGGLDDYKRWWGQLNGDFVYSSQRTYSKEEIEELYNLGLEIVRAEHGKAVKFSEQGEESDEEAVGSALSDMGLAIDSFERFSNTKGGQFAEQTAKMKEMYANSLFWNSKWFDMAVYVRDEIDAKYWDTNVSRSLREKFTSFVPQEIRGEDGKIPDNLDELDWDNAVSRMDSMLRTASGHLFDHPWYIQAGAGVAGCAAGTLAGVGPWGCPIGAVAGVAGDMTAASMTADETWQSFSANYSPVTWLDASFNYSIGAVTSLLATVGFKWKILPLGTWGQKLGTVATWKMFGNISWGVAKDMGGTVKGLAGTVWSGAKYGAVKTANGVMGIAGKKGSSAAVKFVIDKEMVEGASNIWRIIAGTTRDLGPLAGTSMKTKVLRFFRIMKWDPYVGNYVKSGLWGSLGGGWDTAFHIFERMSLPAIIGSQMMKKISGDDDESGLLNGIESFAWMFFATRVGVNCLGIDKGGTRLLFLLDRVQDIIMQWTSGKTIQNVSWEKAMANYISGSIPGQIRGRWLKNILGNAEKLSKGLEVKIAGFASGKLTWAELDTVEREIVGKLLPLANAEGLVVLKKTKNGVDVFRQNTVSRTISDNPSLSLSWEDWKILRRLVRPLEFEMSQFSNAGKVYQYLQEQQDTASVAVLNKVAKMVGSGEARVVVRNQAVFIKKGKAPLEKVGELATSEQKLLRHIATPIKYHPCEYMPGSKAIQSLSEEEQALVVKLYSMVGNKATETITIQGGMVTVPHLFGDVSGYFKPKILGQITPADEMLLRSLLETKFPKLVVESEPIRVKLGANLNFKGMFLFSIIHDTVLGTFYDEVRGRTLMDTSPGSMGTWTFVRSLTTLWPREFVKLHFGWDKKLAVLLDRLLGREFLDPIMTKWVNIWPEKAYWRETYEKAYKSGRLSDFIGFHVASGVFEGGLFLYKDVNTLVYAIDDETNLTPYEGMPKSFGTLSDFYSTGTYKDKKLLGNADYEELDFMVDKLLTEADAVLNDEDGSKKKWIENEYFREDVVLDLALGVAAAAYVANKKNSGLFKDSMGRHAELFDFVGSCLETFSEDGELNSDEVAKFMSDIVSDGEYKAPALLRAYLNKK